MSIPFGQEGRSPETDPVGFAKIRPDADVAVAGIRDGSTILVGGFGDAGIPYMSLDALRRTGIRNLTLVSINAGAGSEGIAGLIAAGSVRRIVCSFPRTAGSVAFEAAYREGQIELELAAMGTLVERLRAGGGGIGGFYTRTGIGTLLAQGKDVRHIAGIPHIFEQAIKADVALVRAHLADPFGNLTYRGVERNLNPVVAKAGALTIAEVEEIVPLGAIPATVVVTPGVYVQRVFQRGRDA
jgi:3-oxoadipate CoA-transferase alpha subunit